MKLGIETEYVFKWIPHPDQDPILPSQLYQHFQESLHVQFEDLANIPLSNGGDFSYEAHPLSLQEGLLESSTPTLENPRDALCYQRAMEELIRDTADQMEESLGQSGIVKVIKNSMDREGHTYGCQENYEVRLTQKGIFFRSVQILLLLLTGLCQAFTFGINGILVLAFLPFLFCYFLGKLASSSWVLSWDKFFQPESLNAHLVKLSYQWNYPLNWINALAVTKFYDSHVFFPIYRQIQDYLITRVIFASSGHLQEDGTFILSERAMGITDLVRQGISQNRKPLFECGHMYKQMILAWTEGFLGNFKPLRELFASQHRIQICYSDANRCDIAEYLKFGITSLLMEMAHKGDLEDIPKIRDPIGALKQFSQDAEMIQKVAMSDGKMRSACEIQKLYQRKLTQFVSKQTLVNTSTHDLNQLWLDVLEKLSKKQEKELFGLIDWITKEKLLSLCEHLTYDERKKIDLSYHDLREGPFSLLEKQGFITQLMDMDDIIDAMSLPPEPGSLQRHMRSSVIKSILDRKKSANKKLPVLSVSKNTNQHGVVIPLFP